MSLSVNNSVSAQYALNSLNKSTNSMNDSIGKISSGQRINRAADDASGMVMADTLGSQARGMGQMIRNANDNINMAQIADSTLGQASEIMMGIREKAIQAASGVQTADSLGAIQADVTKALQFLNDLYKGASFNDQMLLSDAPGLSALSEIDLTTMEGAQAALEITDDALSLVNSRRSDFGSRQNQLEAEISNLNTTMVNTYGAESQIMDLDIAEESMNMSHIENLRTAGMFALSQANVQQKNVISLLNN